MTSPLPDYRDPAVAAVASMHQCHPTDPTKACEERHEAQVQLRFWPTLSGWFHLLPNMIDGPVTHCPWCEGVLPEVTGPMMDVMDTPEMVSFDDRWRGW